MQRYWATGRCSSLAEPTTVFTPARALRYTTQVPGPSQLPAACSCHGMVTRRPRWATGRCSLSADMTVPVGRRVRKSTTQAWDVRGHRQHDHVRVDRFGDHIAEWEGARYLWNPQHGRGAVRPIDRDIFSPV